MAAGVLLALRRAFDNSAHVDLRGQVVLITGSSRGLGLALAREFARRGCRLVLCARDASELERARSDIARLGVDVLAVPCDVADREQVQDVVQRATLHFGQVNVLVANAGVISVGPFADQTIEDFEYAMAVMFWGCVYSVYAVLPQMRARRSGKIAIVTSIGGKVSVPHLMPYSSAKFAATGFAEGLRAELKPDGISVTTIVPGLMRTGSHVNAEFKGRHQAEYAWFSLGATLPFTSLSADDAAARIVHALAHGEAEVVLGWQADLVARLHGLMPGFATDVLGLVNRLLPGPGGVGTQGVRGKASRSAVTESPLETLGRRAARDLNQP